VQVVRSIWYWFNDRTGIWKLASPFIFHPVPPETANLRVGWMYLFGIATLTAFTLQVVTGIALATLYVPSTANAYESLKWITDQATLGSVLRGMHFWGASAMVLFIGIHMIRVFLTGSFKFPREMNWVSGVVLLILTVLMAFTGQLLRWDQNGVWSLFIAAAQAAHAPVIGDWLARFILGGDTVGASTLSRFFAFHVFFIPALIFGTVGFHLYLVLHNGISEPPDPERPVDKRTYRTWYHEMIAREGQPYFPEAAWHEIAFALLLVCAIVLLAAIVGPPKLDNPPNPANINAYPRPDWYLLWYYALFALLSPAVEPFFIILAPLIGFLILFLVPFMAHSGQRSPFRRPWAPAIVVGVVLSIAALWRYGAVAPWSPNFDAKPVVARPGTSTPLVDRGATLFYQKGCEYCHTVNGQGGIRGPNLTNIGQRMDTGQVIEKMSDGADNMPSYAAILTPDEMQSIAAFLVSQASSNPERQAQNAGSSP
jgi:ubiquinol-cytochrome c reductase cytochrome b subunit